MAAHTACCLLIAILVAVASADKFYGYPGKPWDGHAYAAEKYQEYATLYQQQVMGTGPPPHSEVVRMARYVVHNVDWAAMSTISSLPGSWSYPFNNIVSVSDGPVDKSSGIPYMYLTPKDMSVQDLMRDYRSTLVMTLAQSDYCKKQKYDAEDPRCAKVIITGKIKRVKDPAELAFAQNALFSRHPAMKNWPPDHHFYVAKMKIEQIVVFDYFGGPKFVDVKTYLHTPPTAGPLPGM
ncbi:protein CREG1 [Schistocerca gregaria]|uniref:protein CREG1 n=1 Tax=Schistocerca gregaria TaxID=7010 RepID=UPI00211ED12E|nr:protein CREG1 [Schistocerca gregaria]XP_049842921.1 protein CREG1 [Schistocerca gregaria]